MVSLLQRNPAAAQAQASGAELARPNAENFSRRIQLRSSNAAMPNCIKRDANTRKNRRRRHDARRLRSWVYLTMLTTIDTDLGAAPAPAVAVTLTVNEPAGAPPEVALPLEQPPMQRPTNIKPSAARVL
jgi:hypothetical protein